MRVEGYRRREVAGLRKVLYAGEIVVQRAQIPPERVMEIKVRRECHGGNILG